MIIVRKFDITIWFPGSLRSSGGIVDAGPSYQKNLSEEVTKLQRLYGGGDFTKFPDIKFTGMLDFKWADNLSSVIVSLDVSFTVCSCWDFIECVTVCLTLSGHGRVEKILLFLKVLISADGCRRWKIILIICQAMNNAVIKSRYALWGYALLLCLEVLSCIFVYK